MSKKPVRDEEPEIMGGREPAEKRTDVMEGTDPAEDTEVMDKAHSERNRRARLPSPGPSR